MEDRKMNFGIYYLTHFLIITWSHHLLVRFPIPIPCPVPQASLADKFFRYSFWLTRMLSMKISAFVASPYMPGLPTLFG
jgi:hypothetical protein